MTPLQIRNVIENDIRTAFRGVTLGGGLSLRQAQLADSFENGAPRFPASMIPGPPPVTDASFAGAEVTDDWSRVSLDELERDCCGYLDALGFRYYIPALMLSVLDRYDPSSMRVIGALRGLYPRKDDLWDYAMRRYSLLNAAQKAAIAGFLAELPKLVDLYHEHEKMVTRALHNYWGQYL
jgi:hypothetical protein